MTTNAPALENECRTKNPRLFTQTGVFSFTLEGYLKHTFALKLLTCQLALTTDSFCFLTRFTHGRLFEMLLELHFTKNALTLELLFQSTQRLINVVITNTNLHVVFTTFLSLSCKNLQEVAV